MARLLSATAAAVMCLVLPATAFSQSVTDYTYDVHGRLIGSTRSDTATTYVYDKAGNRVSLVTTGGNRGPVVVNDSVTVAAGATISISPLGNDSDPDNDPLRITTVSTATKGTATVVNNGLNISYVANAGPAAVETLIYTVTDGNGLTAQGQIAVTITSGAAIPTAGSATTTINANSGATSLSLNVTGTATSVAVTAQPANGTATASGTQISYTPATNWSGSNTVGYTASNASGVSAPGQLTVLVKPLVGNVSASTGYQSSTTFALAPITNYSSLSLAGSPSKGSASLSGSSVTYTPSNGQSGTDTFGYTATTAGGTSNTGTISVTIGSPPVAPEPPTVGNVSVSTGYNTPASFALAASGNYTSLSVNGGPNKGGVSITGMTATYTPTGGATGQDSFTYVANGPGGTSNTGTASITIATPPPPTAGSFTTTTGFNTPVTVTLQPGGVFTSISGGQLPWKGSVSFSGNTATYTPSTNLSGLDSFGYFVTGPGGTSSQGFVGVEVAAPPSLTAGATAYSYYRQRVGTTWQTYGTPQSITIYGSGGVAPYTYAWERVSGDSTINATNAAGPGTFWNKSLNAVIDNTFVATWRGKVTDSIGQVAYTPDVTVTIEYRIE